MFSKVSTKLFCCVDIETKKFERIIKIIFCVGKRKLLEMAQIRTHMCRVNNLGLWFIKNLKFNTDDIH